MTFVFILLSLSPSLKVALFVSVSAAVAGEVSMIPRAISLADWADLTIKTFVVALTREASPKKAAMSCKIRMSEDDSDGDKGFDNTVGAFLLLVLLLLLVVPVLVVFFLTSCKDVRPTRADSISAHILVRISSTSFENVTSAFFKTAREFADRDREEKEEKEEEEEEEEEEAKSRLNKSLSSKKARTSPR